MSAVTSDWASVETEAPTKRMVVSGKVYRREEEFRSDLNNYMAGYIADQQSCRVAAAGSIGSAARIHCHRAFSALTSGANGECRVRKPDRDALICRLGRKEERRLKCQRI